MGKRTASLSLARRSPRAPFIVLLAILPMVLALDASAAEPASGETPKKVLILSSYDLSLPGPAIVIQGIRVAFRKNSPARFQIYYESLDIYRIPEEKYGEELVGFLKRKYEAEKIDLIISIGAPALRVLVKNRANLLSNTPILFYYFDETEETARRLNTKVTGVWSKPDYGKTMETALALHPETERVFVVAGNSEQDRFLLTEAEKEYRKYEDQVQVTYMTDLTMQDCQEKLASLPPRSVVILLSLMQDSAGKSFSGPEAVSLLAPSANAPVYGMGRTYLGYGIVGGSLVDFEAVGKRVGELGLRVLGGERAQDIPPETVPSVTMFDWRAMRRWGISESRLPEGSIVEFREPTFWELYGWYVIAGVSVGVLEALLIAALLIQRSRRRQAEGQSRRLTSLAEDRRRKLEEVISNVPGIVWESRLEPDGASMKVEFVNSFAETALGYSVEEWTSTPGFLQSIVCEEDREELARQRNAILACGKEIAVQFRWRAKDGRVLWAEAHISPTLDEAGKVIGVRGITLDITSSKLAQEALRQSEQKNLDILRALPDVVFLQSHDGTFLDCHPTESSDLFVAPAAFIGKNMRDVLPPEFVAAVTERFQRAEETGELQFFEYMLPIQGEQRWFEARIIHTEGNQFLSIVRNVTERKRSEAKLIESEERFRNMADTAPVMIWVAGPDKLCTYFNRRWLDFTGRTLEEELGNGWTECVHPDDFERVETYKSAFDGSEPLRLEYRLRRADGEYRWLEVAGVARFSPHGEFQGYIGSCIDVTDRRQAEEASQKAFAQVIELKAQLEAENVYLKEEIRLEHNYDEIIGKSEAIRAVLFKIEQVARTNTTVFIQGETGTGKELVARAIHSTSLRKNKPLVKVNCAALPATLIESELFGHEKGAFTSATARQLGRFELANGGTIFLDEIGDLPQELQAKLLRVLEQGEFERLGSGKTIKVDVRIIAATNRNILVEVQQGRFREDLWYRLNVFPITVPPLCERKEDIPLLAEAFAHRFAKKLGKPIEAVAPWTMRALQDYSWPGNVRELANVIERAVVNSKDTILRLADQLKSPSAIELPSARQTLEALERQYIISVLEQTGWRIEGAKGAARILGLNPSTLRTRMAKLGIEKSKVASE